LIGYFWRRSGEKKRIEKTVNNPENQKEVNELKEMMAPLFTTNSRIKMKEVDKIAKKVCKLDSKSVIKISTLELSEILYRIQIGKTTEKSARNNVLTISKVAEVWEKGYKDLEQELAELKHLKNTRLMEN
jgi:hypothetical protein